MEVAKNSKLGTPVKDPEGYSRLKTPKDSKHSENSNPNISDSTSPLTRSSKSKKHSSKNTLIYSPGNKLRERKFAFLERFPQFSQWRLRRIQTGDSVKDPRRSSKSKKHSSKNTLIYSPGNKLRERKFVVVAKKNFKRRDRLMEEARNSVPECGKVMHLVKAFERILSIPDPKDTDKEGEDEKEPKEEKIDNYNNKEKPLKWALPGLQPTNVTKGDAENDDETSFSSFCSSDFVLTAENLGLDQRFSVSSSWDSSQGRNSNGGRRSRRNSSGSAGTIGGRRWKKQLKPTSLKPFKLRTEQRGKAKEEEFMKKIHEMMIEQEKQRIPIAQGLPWTTDEPDVLIKPPVKESTRPVDLRLHSDVRAVERAEFDHQVAEKMSLIEQYKMERERQQKMAEEEELKRLRKELIPKAQPMPYFDRPFIPRRSLKNPTIPREPKLHILQHKKIKCMSWNDMSQYTFQGNEAREI
ncbi:40S ribosomal protein S19-3-like [Hibiscus syriacus]|uniref:40S ribosomal protein S19-3-like n=1 Tax=Hibiscus syriacus TaxID=106335 RepID=A0A6A3AAL8_HIBSY|nr:40S ribosomal protein S19-3-like [Hibiscus syriacus]